jgi:hypothetical protein
MNLLLDTCVWGGAKAELQAAGHERRPHSLECERRQVSLLAGHFSGQGLEAVGPERFHAVGIGLG